MKQGSAKWINERKFVSGKFSWQEGFGAFSYAKSQLPVVIRYIENQEAHHKKKTFVDEYKKLLIEMDVSFDERYIFKAVE